MACPNRNSLSIRIHIAFIIGCSHINAITIFNNFKVLKNADILGEPFRTDELTDTRLECSVRCSLTSGCSAVNFDHVTGKCKMFSWLNMTVAWATVETTDIVNVGTILFHGKPSPEYGDMTLTAAAAFCNDLGGQLASPHDLYTAHDAGYDLCRCGWVSDGSIRFVVQTNENSCYSYDVGVNSCKWTIQAEDAYCKFN